MIEVKNLVKTYGNFKAVDGISFTAENGKITVLLGPNGAGKSTTIKSIAGLLKFDGEILIDGYDNHDIEAKRVFGNLLKYQETNRIELLRASYQKNDEQYFPIDFLKFLHYVQLHLMYHLHKYHLFLFQVLVYILLIKLVHV